MTLSKVRRASWICANIFGHSPGIAVSVGDLAKGCIGRQIKRSSLGCSLHLVAHGFDKNLAFCLSQAYKDADRSERGHEDCCLLSAFWTSAMTHLVAKAEQCKHIRALDVRSEFLPTISRL